MPAAPCLRPEILRPRVARRNRAFGARTGEGPMETGSAILSGPPHEKEVKKMYLLCFGKIYKRQLIASFGSAHSTPGPCSLNRKLSRHVHAVTAAGCSVVAPAVAAGPAASAVCTMHRFGERAFLPWQRRLSVVIKWYFFFLVGVEVKHLDVGYV